MIFPEKLIVDCGPALPRFMEFANHPELPTLDIAAVFDQILHVVRDISDIHLDDRLTHAALFMGMGEGLFEHSYIETAVQQNIMNAIVELGTQIKNNLVKLNAYSDGLFPYIFEEFVDEQSVVFRLSLPIESA